MMYFSNKLLDKSCFSTSLVSYLSFKSNDITPVLWVYKAFSLNLNHISVYT